MTQSLKLSNGTDYLSMDFSKNLVDDEIMRKLLGSLSKTSFLRLILMPIPIPTFIWRDWTEVLPGFKTRPQHFLGYFLLARSQFGVRLHT